MLRVRTAWILAVAFVVGVGGAWGNAVPERVTFTRDVAPIFFDNCVSCHRPGEVAPMSLRNYEEARPWAKSIKEKVSKKEMPPWFADPSHGVWLNDASLSEVEIATITKWVDQGARQGDVAEMPELPEFTEGWQMGEPDFVIDMPEVTVPASGSDYFPNLTFTADVPDETWVRAIEIRPSNRAVAHHVVVFMNGFGSGMGDNFNVLGVWAVGTAPNVYPEGMGRKITPGQRFMTNMHYHPNGVSEEKDTTRIGLYYSEEESPEEVLATLTGNVTLWVPPGEANHEEISSWYVDDDIRIVSFFPHMHMRGKDMSFNVVYPDGHEKMLLSVPEYDFDWQLFYYPDEPVFLPAGSRIDLLAHYDNSAGNESNPDPTVGVGFGLESTDEMMFGIFEYVYDDGESPSGADDVDRLAMMAKTFPAGEAYAVDFKMGSSSIPSILHLPRVGDGRWVVSFNGMQLNLPVRDVEWDGDSFSFAMTMRFGKMGGDMRVTGALDGVGGVTGDVSAEGEGLMMMSSFEGTAAN